MKVKRLWALLLTLALSAALRAQTAQELYQRGLVEEQSRGNLKEAIKLYAQAAKAAGKDRPLAAKALIRSAGSQEKLGQLTEAAAAYAEVLRTYPEQPAEAAVAQERLAFLRQSSSGGSSGAHNLALLDVSATTSPVFEKYCSNCHNSAARLGRLDLTALNARNVSENTVTWETLLRRLRARHDPPADSPRPDDKTYRSMILKLETALDEAYPENRPAAGDLVTDTELATRIAALLWGTAPDASLLDDARTGKLQVRAVLDRQVRRMLRDTRSVYLATSFLQPWLSLEKIKTIQPDPGAFPQFDAELLQSMETETRLFLESQLRDDRNVVELWTADYTFLNERMARHYGIPKVAGKDFRRVAWPDKTRAGILGQAGPLAALSFPRRSSPTVRGVYLLTSFLGMQADPPPANVPGLSPQGDRPMRERMKAHSSNPSCANCHVKFEPMGLALENFDGIGRWRTTDFGSAIDATGSFVDGTSFNGPAELRAGLLKYRDAYYTNLTQQLFAHALSRKGRGGRLYDYEMPSVREIVRTASSNDYRWSAIITGIVSSTPFRMKNLVP